ncbi:hypothetical protein OSTOST_00945, partial [Ostertagia ostertagi]
NVTFKDIINIERELAKLASKKEKIEAQVAKLLDQESRADYEAKVPLPVRVTNTEKKEALLIEIRSIETAMAALRS